MIYVVTNKLQIEEMYPIVSLNDCLDYFNNHKEIQLDTETTGYDVFNGDILTIQLGDFDNQFVIDCSYVHPTKVKEFLENKEKLFLLQNAKFDLRFFLKYGINIKNVYDTFLAECILTTGYKERELSLEHLAMKYCNAKLNKEIRSVIHIEGLTSRVIKYAAEDVKYLSIIKEAQLKQITNFNLERVLQLENEVVRVFARMEFNGAKINREEWLKVADYAERSTIECEEKLDNLLLNEPKLKKFQPKYSQTNLFGIEERKLNINWSSNQQKLAILNELGIPITSVGDRELQRNKQQHEIIKTLIDYNKNAKIESSFGKKFIKFINKHTGRIHPEIWQIISTGRISVAEPNLNQIPARGEFGKLIRKCFIPEEGYKYVGGDYSGCELRLLAEFSQDPLWLQVFREDGDLHSILCTKTFGISIEDIKQETPFKKGITYRELQKTIDFGLAYGMSAFKLADTMEVSVQLAQSIIDSFFNAVPEVKLLLDEFGRLGTERGYIKTSQPFSRIRWFQEWNNAVRFNDFTTLGSIDRASRNTPLQGSNGDIIKQALINVQEVIDVNDYPVKIIMAVYDEIQTECGEDFAKEWKNILENIMIETAKIVIKTIPVKVDCKINDYWSK